MATMIPASIERTDPRRHGEYMVFDWLSSDAVPGYCFYSLPQTTHPHKLMGEVDFLYVCENGILCIEVKGGQDIYRDGRNWFSVNRKGVTNPISNPFEQSRGCMHALKNYLVDTFGKDSTEAKFQLGYCVVFPECIGRCKGADIAIDVLFDCSKNLSDFPSFLQNTLAYWAEEEKRRHFGRQSLPLTKKQVSQMVNLLQANFRSVPSMRLELQSIAEKMLRLSEEQYDVVESMIDNKRVIVHGGAGTGKSLLAIEKARSALARNKHVLYVCFNRNMAQYAKSNLPESDRITVSTLHALIASYTAGAVYKMTTQEACRYFKEVVELSSIRKYDVLVVDEGQDLMCDVVWDTLDMFLSKGLEKSEWVVFTDPNQSIFTDNSTYDEGIEYLTELYSPFCMRLNKNWRNTAQIARRTSRISHVPHARHMKLDGPKVEKRSYTGKVEFLKQIKEDIRGLLMGGVAPEDIIILSQRKLENSLLAEMKEYSGLRLVEMSDLSSLRPKQLNFATVQSYKGLESNVVFYVDIMGFRSMPARKLNYVAMSRAKVLLYMYVGEEQHDEYDYMMDESI